MEQIDDLLSDHQVPSIQRHAEPILFAAWLERAMQ